MAVGAVEPEAVALLDELGTVLGKLTAADLTVLSGEQLLGFTREFERFTRAGAVVAQAAVAELDSRHVAAEHGLANTATLLADLLRLDPGQARRRVRDARDFGPRRGLGGEPLPALHPHTAHALAAGEIGIEHARAIADLFDHIPPQTEQDQQVIETAALDVAAVCGPHRLRQWCVLAASRIDPDGQAPNEETKRRDRAMSVIDLPGGPPACGGGWAKLTGRLTPHAAAALRAVLGPLSAPAPAEDGTRDQRTAAQRRHDGLAEACTRLLTSATLPDSGGAPTTLLVTIDYRDLLARTGHGTTSYGTLIPVAELLRRASDAAIIPVVLNDAGGIMAYGRTHRLAIPALRRALAARDRGCARPGCTIPADWCETHHVTPWQHGGRTDIDNLALVCPHDHHELDRGASIQMINGIPHWTDPPHLDPHQTPRRNTAHHIPRILIHGMAPDPQPPAHKLRS